MTKYTLSTYIWLNRPVPNPNKAVHAGVADNNFIMVSRIGLRQLAGSRHKKSQTKRQMSLARGATLTLEGAPMQGKRRTFGE